MPYAKPFLRLAVSGPLYTTEAFSFSLSLIQSGTSAAVPTGISAAAVTPLLSALFQGASVGSHAKAAMVKCNLIGTDGRYVDKAGSVFVDLNPPVASSISAPSAPQLSLAVSLQTAARRGLASSGRFYLPAPSFTLGSDGRIPVAGVTAVSTAAGDFIRGVNSLFPGWQVGVVSNVREGAQRQVTSLRVGRVIDTIRSRRTSMDEGYVSNAGFTAGGGTF